MPGKILTEIRDDIPKKKREVKAVKLPAPNINNKKTLKNPNLAT
jgi:hypothetical protein